MSAAYERVRQSLKGTTLAGDLDRLNAELRLTPDAAEWIIAALTAIGSAGLSRDLQAMERAIAHLPNSLTEAMRAAAGPIVEGLAADVRSQVVEAVREDAKATLIDLLGQALDIHATEVGNLVKSQDVSAKALTTAAQSAVADVNKRAMTTGDVLMESAAKLAGWSTVRVSYVCFGIMLGGALLAIGFFGRIGGDLRECNVRVKRLAIISHYDAHAQNLLRHAACDL